MEPRRYEVLLEAGEWFATALVEVLGHLEPVVVGGRRGERRIAVMVVAGSEREAAEYVRRAIYREGIHPAGWKLLGAVDP